MRTPPLEQVQVRGALAHRSPDFVGGARKGELVAARGDQRPEADAPRAERVTRRCCGRPRARADRGASLRCVPPRGKRQAADTEDFRQETWPVPLTLRRAQAGGAEP